MMALLPCSDFIYHLDAGGWTQNGQCERAQHGLQRQGRNQGFKSVFVLRTLVAAGCVSCLTADALLLCHADALFTNHTLSLEPWMSYMEVPLAT